MKKLFLYFMLAGVTVSNENMCVIVRLWNFIPAHGGGGGGKYSNLSWLRMSGPKFGPPPYN